MTVTVCTVMSIKFFEIANLTINSLFSMLFDFIIGKKPIKRSIISVIVTCIGISLLAI